MKKYSAILLLFVFNLYLQGNSFQTGVFFTENKGQVADQFNKQRNDILYYGASGDLIFHLGNNGISYHLSRIEEMKVIDVAGRDTKVPSKICSYRIDVEWLDVNKNNSLIPANMRPGYNNYYLGVCPEGIINVRSYNELLYKSIYNNIDLRYYQKNDHLKYDYLVHPGADLNKIKLKIKGANEITILANGSLLIKTPLGDILEEKPVAFQNNKQLPAKWIVNKDIISFEISDYDPSKELIIDPVIVSRIWGTYYGGAGYDQVYGSATDSNDNVIITGNTSSLLVIATSGSHQNTIGGSNDAYVVKFNTYGVRQWATYYGGTADDYGYSCTVESDNIYFGGTTTSTNAISTAGAHQSVIGGAGDAFLVKLNTYGVSQWATYYGGAASDQGNCCVADLQGNIYLSGLTQTSGGTVIATSGAHQVSHSGGNEAFLVKFDGNGTRLWGTYYGGSLYDSGNACSADSLGNIYLSGHTQSTSGIATAGSYQSNLNGTRDAYLAKFNSSGVRQWGTYYGGAADDWAFGMITHKNGEAYITGNTFSSNGISTAGVYQTVSGGLYDAFLAKFSASGNLVWGTYYGGSSMEAGVWPYIDPSSNIYLTGYTQSTVGITSAGSYQLNYGGGQDAFISKFNPSGSLQWSTYYGGAGYEQGNYVVGDKAGAIYMAGFTDSNTSTVIATSNGHQSAYSGASYDGMLVKFSDCLYSPLGVTSTSTLLCSGNSATLSASGANTYTWNTSVTGNSITITPTINTTYTVYANDVNMCQHASVYTQSVTPCTVLPENAINGSMYVFPNPVNDFLCVNGIKGNVTLYNSLGSLISETKVEGVEDHINVAELAAGIYYLKFFIDKGLFVFKLIKQ